MTLYVVGAGGLGQEVLDVATAVGLAVTAFVDERVAGTIVRDLPVVDAHEVENSAEHLIGIAHPRVRARLADLLDTRGAVARTLVHPTAVVAPGTSFGFGSLWSWALRTSPAASPPDGTARCSTAPRWVTTR